MPQLRAAHRNEPQNRKFVDSLPRAGLIRRQVHRAGTNARRQSASAMPGARALGVVCGAHVEEGHVALIHGQGRSGERDGGRGRVQRGERRGDLACLLPLSTVPFTRPCRASSETEAIL